jgi:hypothetical protein
VFIFPGRRYLFVGVLDTLDIQVAHANVLLRFLVLLVEDAEGIGCRSRCRLITCGDPLALLKHRTLLTFSLHHHVLLGLLLESIPLLFEFVLDFALLDGNERARCVSSAKG